MGRSQETFSKKQKEKKKAKKKQDKMAKREERKQSSSGGSLDDMIAYVDEFGNITDTPPEEQDKKEEIEAEDIVIGIPPKEESEEGEQKQGRVSFFNYDKGYGFIQDLNSKKSYFVHQSNCTEQINEGDKVTFDTEEGPKGTVAVGVSRK